MTADNFVRLDKWLWAARFFKTRSIAKEAIDGGKVHCDGVKGKASRAVTVGMTLKIRQGFNEKTVIVKDLSSQRGPAKIAQTLYEETDESIKKREALAVQRQSMPKTEGKPDKRQRRQIHRFKRDQN
ncbi:RNA-binding S4 domain-containing protein [Kangiella sediminilitoris]|uniref:Heat shock protein 15 n=1 Tax=Kangiella sediminilitoris TaxID=1144748 RepID=A0A1B3B896_9GAMM|nr:S4 domain-containing protein [Kangiella sediminilitoris]AOE49017.1 ribosome-associated heat shock protein Hsp15 [Kangiella sediminilitoris]